MAAPTTSSRPRRYSVEEILSLRSSLPVVNCVVRKLNKHPDIAVIFRIPEEALNDPDRYYCQSQALVDATNRRKVSQLEIRCPGVSTDESEEQVISSSKLTNNSRPQQWHLRRRDISNRSSEPHPAPSGIASQQSENFQRFYRAVVSPTHVRVTAGGRIVPNTRTSAPPQFNWNPEKCLFEPRRPFEDIELNTSQVQNLWLPNTPQPVVASPLPPAPLPNYNFLPQTVSIAQSTMAAQKLSNLQPTSDNGQAPKEATNVQQPIKISPPSQFDHSRPFIFNGQLVYPVPAGFQPPQNSVPLPISVLGDPNLPHQVPTIGNFPPLQPFPMPIPTGNFAGPFMMPPSSIGHFPMMLPNGGSPMDGGFNLPPYMLQPASGMVSLSELTKFQIQGLRNQVKHIDSQTANNQHLVDELFLQRQRNELMSFIEKMEYMLQTQLGQERNHLSQMPLNDKIGVTNSASTGNSSTETLTNAHPADGNKSSDGPEHNKLKKLLPPVKSREELKNKGLITVSPVVVPPIPLFVPSSQTLGTQSKTEELQLQQTTHELKPMIKSEPAIKSRLTAAAAKAPPFQPRAHTLARRSESNPASDAPTEASADSKSSSVLTQGVPTPYPGTPVSRREATLSFDLGQLPSGLGHASLFRAHSIQAPHMLDNNYAGLLQRSSTFHTVSAVQEAATFEAAGKGHSVPHPAVPYLVGSLPLGMHISEAQGSDFVYARPLTEEEVRARHLYWGDAPRSAMKGSGLPKFDGKDFYPPSPMKRMAVPISSSNANANRSSPALPDFEHLFDEPGMPGYQTLAQVRLKSSEQNFLPSPTQVFLENGIIGYQSPSPRPATYKFDNTFPPNWSPSSYGSIGNLAQKTAKTAFKAAKNPVDNDFSTLFTSPTAPRNIQSTQNHPNKDKSQPATPNNKALSESGEGEDDETGTLDSWGAPKAIGELEAEDVDSHKTNTNDSPSNTSTVEIRLTSKDRERSPKRGYGTSFAERMNNGQSGDQHTLFLQNMLRNAAATMVTPPLSGAVSSATAQGYLPQYRGSAAASLAPAMLTMNALEREDESVGMKADQPKIVTSNGIKVPMEGVVPLVAANFSAENRPTNRDRPPRPILASVESMGAEGYKRYLAQKVENDKKIIEQGWNPNTTGTGPVMGSDW